MESGLNAPHGEVLQNSMVDEPRAQALKQESRDWPSWDLTARQLCDLELLLNGGFSPLTGFLGHADYDRVVSEMRLADGTLWPIPVTLDVTEQLAELVATGQSVALRDQEGVMLAALHVQDVWRPDRGEEAEGVFGTMNPEHPGVNYLLSSTHPVYVGGSVEGVSRPVHYDYRDLRLTPAELRDLFTKNGWSRVVAFQTRNPMHRAHVELTRRAADEVDAALLIHPSVGMTKPGDVDHYTRVRCYQAVLDRYPEKNATLALLPLAMRMGGPREAVWHAIIRKNHGCSHLIVGRDHAGPGSDSKGHPFYGPYEAQELLAKHEVELGMGMVDFKMMVYAPSLDEYFPDDEVPPDTRTVTISGTQLRERLQTGQEIPEWFSYPEVVQELRRTHPARSEQGFAVFFTGLSGSGKSTIANALLVKLLERGGRSVSLLDGDLVRKNLSSELGFSKEHRDLNIRRIGYVASEIARAGGVVICAPIAPYDATRKAVRAAIEEESGFTLVYVRTPLEVCEERDRKGLYAKARAGLIPEFTGVSDPYEEPEDAEIVIDTMEVSPDEAAERIIEYLAGLGYLFG
ncbi:MAG: bifunctional sulfate adenylyltransferase/adenylylsulfate kinase [Acidimicrobiia bacterium]